MTYQQTDINNSNPALRKALYSPWGFQSMKRIVRWEVGRSGRVDTEWKEKCLPILIAIAGRLEAYGVDVISLLNP